MLLFHNYRISKEQEIIEVLNLFRNKIKKGIGGFNYIYYSDFIMLNYGMYDHSEN